MDRIERVGWKTNGIRYSRKAGSLEKHAHWFICQFPSMNNGVANYLAVGFSLFGLFSVRYNTARADTACQYASFDLWRLWDTPA